MTDFSSYPHDGKFGEFGGQYVPEILMSALETLEKNYLELRSDSTFQSDLTTLLNEYAGRPTPLYYAKNLTKKLGGPKIYLKREDFLHGGAHKINNTLGQALFAKKTGKNKIIAETGAGQHGVATAMASSLLGLNSEIFMGSDDVKRQKLNVFRMELLGATVNSVTSGSKTLKDAINEAMREWVANVETTHYLLGSVVGPHPYPMMVRDFQKIIGDEIKSQIIDKENMLPTAILASVGGGSNSMGTFYPFIDDLDVDLFGIEPGGEGNELGKHASSIMSGSDGVFHGMRSYFLQNNEGQIASTHSISAGLDYPGVGPEHAFLKKMERAKYVSISDEEALDAFIVLSRTEGIIPALEPAHAIAYAIKLSKELEKSDVIVVTLSGRGDKDVDSVSSRVGINL